MTGRQLRVDRGGTLTVIVGFRPDGQPVTHKPLSQNPAGYADWAAAAVHAP